MNVKTKINTQNHFCSFRLSYNIANNYSDTLGESTKNATLQDKVTLDWKLKHNKTPPPHKMACMQISNHCVKLKFTDIFLYFIPFYLSTFTFVMLN